MNFSLSPVTCDKEPNDNFAQAISMGALNESNKSASLVEKGCISSSNDVDYYNFTVPSNISTNMSVHINTDTVGDINMCLYNSEKEELGCGDDYYSYSGVQEDLAPGNYYVKVEGLRPGVAYELTVERGY